MQASPSKSMVAARAALIQGLWTAVRAQCVFTKRAIAVAAAAVPALQSSALKPALTDALTVDALQPAAELVAAASGFADAHAKLGAWVKASDAKYVSFCLHKRHRGERPAQRAHALFQCARVCVDACAECRYTLGALESALRTGDWVATLEAVNTGITAAEVSSAPTRMHASTTARNTACGRARLPVHAPSRKPRPCGVHTLTVFTVGACVCVRDPTRADRCGIRL
ncbi:hypothetical protein EON67_01665 [archaeon]|nr:MAG: hypothetical protein EON67_01665 [archaeon]